jgi:beta-mannanase
MTWVMQLRVSSRATRSRWTTGGLARGLAVAVVASIAVLTGCTAPPRPVPPATTKPPTPTTVPVPTTPPTTAPSTPVPAVPLRDRIAFGAYVPDLPFGRTGLPALESQLGAQLQIASSFTDWDYVFGNDNDRWMAADNTRKVLYSWEPFDIRFAEIAEGGQDAYFQRIADSMKRYPYDIYVRPWGEMNANWSSWQPTPGGEKRDGGTPAEFIAAWRHTVSFFRDQGVNNLKFVFNPDASDFANNTRIPTIWPGASFVDVLGIDGYNWGQKASTGDTWREFDTIFTNMYGILTGLHPTAPVWIAEFGSKEPAANDGAPLDTSHTKAAWFNRMMSSTGFPRLKAVSYFNVKKERDWRIESSPASVAALRDQLARRTTITH